MSEILGHYLTIKILTDAKHVLGTGKPRVLMTETVPVVLDCINQTTLIPIVLGIM